ncbi:DUF1801 domain-containing protein [Gillisia sp. M10.2A]|uniref:DUF1801 domain-containing protein n=1 Tax=Gillisia lutea TaxID=2909668 RepID=A0ABS9EJF6_9FLAO|nr:DUF1801 domain-containing protein [Gillisia lutea]MCF4102472.1 DUF1801 domain-containing protein [Gillisia lutea]
MAKVSTVDEYIELHSKWENHLTSLKQLLETTKLTENIKWGAPVYTLKGKNVIGMGAFKNHCALWFFQGVLLKKHTKLLVNAQEGKTKALRQIRFELDDKIEAEEVIKYIEEAIQLQEQGKIIKPNLKKKLNLPIEMKDLFVKEVELKDAFFSLTPGKQREYADYIMEAKRPETKQRRLEKISPMIRLSIGLHDKYKNC